MNYPIPHNSTQQAVALSIADVLKARQSNRKLSEYPYALAFFKRYFGVRTPRRSQLLSLSAYHSANIKDITKAIEIFIRTNGQIGYTINPHIKFEAFPSLKNAKETKFSNRYDMHSQCNEKIQIKQKDAHQALLDEKLAALMTMSNKQLSGWVAENEEHFNKFELFDCLMCWFKQHKKSNWTFYDLYHGIEPSKIAYDLSFDD